MEIPWLTEWKKVNSEYHSTIHTRVYIEDIESNLDELLHKDLRATVIHVGTNNSVINSPQVVFNKLMSLEKEIQSVVPNCNVIISNLIKRKDSRQANSINEKVNQPIKNSQLRVINTDTIKEKHLGKRGLHLNTHGNLLLTNFYMLSEIQSEMEMIMIQILLTIMYFFVYADSESNF